MFYENLDDEADCSLGRGLLAGLIATAFPIAAFLIAMWLVGCGGDTSVDVSNNQSQNQGPGFEPQTNEEACAICVGNPDDDQSDEDCLAKYNLVPADC